MARPCRGRTRSLHANCSRSGNSNPCGGRDKGLAPAAVGCRGEWSAATCAEVDHPERKARGDRLPEVLGQVAAFACGEGEVRDGIVSSLLRCSLSVRNRVGDPASRHQST